MVFMVLKIHYVIQKSRHSEIKNIQIFSLFTVFTLLNSILINSPFGLQMKWCRQVYPDPLPIVNDLITETLKSLDPPLHSCVNLYVQHRDTLSGLIELKQVSMISKLSFFHHIFLTVQMDCFSIGRPYLISYMYTLVSLIFS